MLNEKKSKKYKFKMHKFKYPGNYLFSNSSMIFINYLLL